MRFRVPLCLIALSLAGCSILDVASHPSAEQAAQAAPAYRRIIAIRIKEILGDPTRAGVMQISGVRRVEYLRGTSWLVCLKASAFLQPRYYAIFLQGDNVVESRLAVIVDGCDRQPYELFNWQSEAAVESQPARPRR